MFRGRTGRSFDAAGLVRGLFGQATAGAAGPAEHPGGRSSGPTIAARRGCGVRGGRFLHRGLCPVRRGRRRRVVLRVRAECGHIGTGAARAPGLADLAARR
ncbi:hypothetical protein ACFOHS_13440 [Jhaorihella thermophila]